MKPEYQQVRFLAPDVEKIPATFGIVTACNPDGVTVTEEENRVATERLRGNLEENALTYFGVPGCSPDLQHREPGFGIAGITRDEIVHLGQQWRQEAGLLGGGWIRPTRPLQRWRGGHSWAVGRPGGRVECLAFPQDAYCGTKDHRDVGTLRVLGDVE